MEPDELFLETINDLRSRVDRPRSEYEVLGTSKLLRQLLLDREPLVAATNRERRLKVRYIANDRPPIWMLAGSPRPTFWAREDGFDPATALTRTQPVEMDQKHLLTRVVLLYQGHDVTVKELIQYVAHVAGGVHLGKPENDKEEALVELAKRIRVGGYPAGSLTLLAIGRVVVKGLEPLHQRVEDDLATPS